MRRRGNGVVLHGPVALVSASAAVLPLVIKQNASKNFTKTLCALGSGEQVTDTVVKSQRAHILLFSSGAIGRAALPRLSRYSAQVELEREQ